MAKKDKNVYVCSNCGYESLKWLGQCPNCKEWNTFTEQAVQELENKVGQLILGKDAKAQPFTTLDQVEVTRIPTAFRELDTVLNGGFLPDQVVLLAGDPGIGKSTLLLQVALNIATDRSVLYVSAEESASQVFGRAKRIKHTHHKLDNLLLLSSGNLQNIMAEIDAKRPELVLVDSIQTIYDEDVTGTPGSVSQVKSCAARLITKAKQEGFILIIVGHITKEGSIAGPKVLEHLVDTVLQFEGDNLLDYRVLRSLKNRFGQVGEVGLFIMTEQGLTDISPDSNIFIDSGVQQNIGVARTIVVEGQRALLVDIQALVSPTVFTYPKRVADGLSVNRIQTICAIVSKFSKVNLSDSDVYVRVTGGYSLKDPAADLAIAQALISSVKKEPLGTADAYLGELNLAGRVLAVNKLSTRLAEAIRFGVTNVYMSGNQLSKFKDKKLTSKVSLQSIDSLSR